MRVAMISEHASPLACLGGADAGGQNVYVGQLARHLARRGWQVDVFTRRDIRFSEASFRKYVQVGLLPRSRRVGRKGKHKGSLGLYPPKTIRRINEVKRLMGEGYTIDEIGAQFLHFTDLIENLDEAVAELCGELDAAVGAPDLDVTTRRALARDVTQARQLASELVERLTQVTHRVAAPRTAQLRRSGAAGAASLSGSSTVNAVSHFGHSTAWPTVKPVPDFNPAPHSGQVTRVRAMRDSRGGVRAPASVTAPAGGATDAAGV